MEVCPNCFSDKELKGFILSSKNIGTCSVCNSKNIALLEISELLDFFQELLENFQIADEGKTLTSMLYEDWNLFSSNDSANIILNEVLPKVSAFIFSPGDIVNYNDDTINNYSHWESLKEELKWSRRFLSNIDHLVELGWDGFFNTQFELKPHDKLYRARVHHQSGLDAYAAEKMKCPKADKVVGGRANPLGIPYIYLSDNPETVLYEVRASFLDELSIAIFNLKEEYETVKIVDFTEETSLFQPTKINETIKAHLLRELISQDLSKPMRRYDSEIEYIPTQFICEFLKVFTGARGIRFRSSLHPKGNNIVMFDEELLECGAVALRKVNSLNLSAIDLK